MRKAIGTLVLVLAMASVSLAAANSTMGFGVDAFVITGMTIQGVPHVRFMLGEGRALDAGFTYVSDQSAGPMGTTVTTTSLTALARYENILAKVNKSLNTNWGAALAYTSNNDGSSVIALSGSLGAEYFLVENIALYGNVNLLTFSSTSGGGRTLSDFYLITGSPLSYTGFRVYL